MYSGNGTQKMKEKWGELIYSVPIMTSLALMIA